MQHFFSKSQVTQLSLICGILLLSSCGKERTNFLAKTYHKTTSYFNGYYNANEILKATTSLIDEQYEYPGGGLFDIYYIGNEDEVKNYETDFDKIIEKNDIVIYKHPNGGFADDCRFMNGQSHFYKKDFKKAMENFDDVIENFPESKILPKTYLWKAMTHYEAGNPELAVDVLEEHIFPYDTIEFDKRGELDMAIFQSKLAIDTSDYMAAAEHITPIVDKVRGRQNKAKAHFLLAQLYAKVEDFPQSFEHYELVEKYSQDYDLTFLSKIQIAHLYIDFSEGQDDDQKVFEYLIKLLNDEKNLDYADQILYELGQLELKKDSINNALDYFRESVAANGRKPRFKALSSYSIGKVYFEQYQNYDSAQVYFDLAANSITKNDAEYDEITTIAKTLRDYVAYKNTITYQDSMLWLYSLSEEELEKVVAKVAEDEERKRQEELRKERERKAAEERELRANMGGNGGRGMNNSFMNSMGQNRNGGNSRQRGGSWYFDNPTAVTQGITQFQAKWGRRANEDHWRRSRKALSFANQGEGGEEAELTPEQVKADSMMKEEFGDNFKYYVDIPKNGEDSTKSEASIEEAMYGLGRIYAQKLNEPDSAIKTFETLLDRYEDSEFDLRSRYALYQLYKDAENPIFNVHKNFILNEHPKSIYAYLILGKDPNELKAELNDFAYAYTGLLTSYRDRQYETAIGFSEFLLGQFGTDNPDLDYAELHYIRGMSYGYMGNRDSLRDILTYVVGAFPESDVTPLAQRTLDYMRNGKSKSTRPGSATKTAKTNADPELTDPNNPRYQGFTAEPKANDKIFVLMYIDQKNVSKGEATSKVSNFNKANFAKLNLKTFTFLYQGKFLLPYISHFKTQEEAAAYVNKFLADPIAKELLPVETDRVFYIHHSNFKLAYGRKRMEDYMLFFENVINK